MLLEVCQESLWVCIKQACFRKVIIIIFYTRGRILNLDSYVH